MTPGPRNAARTDRGWPIRWLLFAIVVAAALPLCVYLSTVLVSQARDAESDAKEFALSTATAAAAWTRDRLRSTEHLAAALAERPLARKLDSSACDPLIVALLPLYPEYANISVIDRGRHFVCSARTPDNPAEPSPLHLGLVGAFEGRFALSEPLVGIVPPVLMVSAAYPVRDASDTIVGALTIPIRLSALRPIDDPAALPRGTRVRIIDGNGTLLASSTHDDRDLGRRLRGSTTIDAALAQASGSSRLRNSDGADTIFGFASVGIADWRALAEVPAAEMLGNEQRRNRTSLLLAAITVGLALLAAALIARHIAKSLRALQGAMDVNAGGGWAYAPVAGPSEISSLAQNFNAMLDQRSRATQALRENDARLKLAVGAAQIGAWDWDISGGRVYLSPEWKRQLGFEDGEIGNDYKEWESRLHPDEHARVVGDLERFIESKSSSHESEFRLRAKDDTWRCMFNRAEVVRDAAGKATRMIGAHIDVTERKQMEIDLKNAIDELRGMAMRIADAEDNERRHISRELHDRIGGNLAALQIGLGMLGDKIAQEDLSGATTLIDDARSVTLATSGEIRTLMSELRP
ncbi:MAG TPA: PAS domain-containing protein, partial [Burkholderiales bacterium]|nr:PAS domain-containing protein [Burkholderiales bacterium]